MINLIVTIILGVVFAIIAIQNRQGVDVQIFNSQFLNIPAFIVIVASLLCGVLLAALIGSFKSMGHFFADRKKNNVISNARNRITQLEKKVHDLEIENAELRGIEKTAPEPIDDKPTYKPSLIDKLRHSY